jgi:hypothetical protein
MAVGIGQGCVCALPLDCFSKKTIVILAATGGRHRKAAQIPRGAGRHASALTQPRCHLQMHGDFHIHCDPDSQCDCPELPL